jgi:cyanophycinase-like exopeptidase
VQKKPRLLVLIGSGEMAPQMARVHRSVINRLAEGTRAGASAVRAAVVDTPYGFQENADALSAEAVDFFGRRLGLDVRVAALRRADADLVSRETAYATVLESDFVFSGPGSPSYALSQWSASRIPTLFAAKLLNGGALVAASAAALTLGRFTAPIYEIYKAGGDPRWLPGLDVLAAVGINAVVVPHWDNTDGSTHDTRYCFLGKRRFEQLEAQLPDDVFVLGIDEHTALVVDLDAGLATVRGRGAVTVRRQGHEVLHATGEELHLDQLVAAPSGARRPGPSADGNADGDQELAQEVVALRTEANTLEKRAALVGPLVTQLVEMRSEARAIGAYVVADRIRDRLTSLGIEITDASDGETGFRLPD